MLEETEVEEFVEPTPLHKGTDFVNILSVYNGVPTGSSYYRQEMPHDHLVKNYNVNCYYIPRPSQITKELIDKYEIDIVLFSRHVDLNGFTPHILAAVKSLGVKTVLDIDDYWRLSGKHVLKESYRVNKIPEQIVEAVKNVDLVIATTPQLADKVRPLNKVEVIPNAIYRDYGQFTPQPKASDKLRFGWFGGTCHTEDINLLRNSFEKLKGNDFELVLGGWIDDPVCHGYEKVFTGNGRIENYRRINASDVYNYAYGYNLIDIALAPLNKNDFNQAKSELKAIEAGFHKKGLIVSNISPYTNICNDKNSFLVNKDKDWLRHINYIRKNPNAWIDKSNQLHEDVKRYDLDLVNKKRFEVYKQITK